MVQCFGLKALHQVLTADVTVEDLSGQNAAPLKSLVSASMTVW